MSRKPGPGRALCLAFAAGLLSAAGQAHEGETSADVLDACHYRDTPNQIVCGDATLSSRGRELNELAHDKAKQLDRDASETLMADQKDWLRYGSNQCVTARLANSTPRQVEDERRCIAEQYARRRAFLANLSVDSRPRAPYLLSAFERAILADDGARTVLIQRALNRVIDAVLSPSFVNAIGGPHDDNIAYFTQAADKSVNNNVTIDGPYLSGWTFLRHAGFYHYYTVVDLTTGAVIIASSMPGNIHIAFKVCVSDAFKTYAAQKIRGWLGPLDPDGPVSTGDVPAQEFPSQCDITQGGDAMHHAAESFA